MKKIVLLSANNVNTNIDVTVCKTMTDAKEQMESEFESTKENSDVEEEEFDKKAASIFTTNGDLFYWQIKEIEI